MARLIERVESWVRRMLGDAHMSRMERAARLLEETVELAQAEGVPADLAARLVFHVYSRPTGNPNDEGSAVALALYGWSAASGVNLCDAALAEIDRIEALPKDRILASLARKIEAGLVTTVPIVRKHQPFEYDSRDGADGPGNREMSDR